MLPDEDAISHDGEDDGEEHVEVGDMYNGLEGPDKAIVDGKREKGGGDEGAGGKAYADIQLPRLSFAVGKAYEILLGAKGKKFPGFVFLRRFFYEKGYEEVTVRPSGAGDGMHGVGAAGDGGESGDKCRIFGLGRKLENAGEKDDWSRS